jgi:hypothetical protein
VSNRLQEIEAEFDKHVSIKDITQHMDVDPEGIQYIYNYWKLKRKVGWIIQHYNLCDTFSACEFE